MLEISKVQDAATTQILREPRRIKIAKYASANGQKKLASSGIGHAHL